MRTSPALGGATSIVSIDKAGEQRHLECDNLVVAQASQYVSSRFAASHATAALQVIVCERASDHRLISLSCFAMTSSTSLTFPSVDMFDADGWR